MTILARQTDAPRTAHRGASASETSGEAAQPAPAAATTVVASPLAGYLARSHDRHRRADDGAVATYIPELGRADPTWFGVAAVTLDGRVHQVGDTAIPFTIQSCLRSQYVIKSSGGRDEQVF